MKDVETEIKLLASPAMLEALRRHPLLHGEDHASHLVTTYFDTADGRLHRAGASLRLRRCDARCEQTFKQPGQTADQRGPAVQREEWNAPAICDRPDPSGFPAGPAAALERLVEDAELAEFAAVKVQRQTREVSQGASRIEIAFDAGEIDAGGRSEPICELELELIEGTLQDVLVLARALPLGPELRWSVAAKANRAFALARAAPAGAVHAARIALAPDMPVIEAFRTICWSCLDHLLGNYGLLGTAAQNEALHQCRVAIRRLRAALGLFSSASDPEATQRFRDAFGSAAHALGEARELHVLLEALAKAAERADLPDVGDAALVLELTARRDAALASASARMASEAFQRLLFEFAGWVEAVDCEQAQTLPAFAARVLDHHRKRVKHGGRHVQAMTDSELHRLRIKVKKLRYAVEFFAGLAGQEHARAAEKYAGRLGQLQDRLGALHDLSERTAQGPLFAAYEAPDAARLQDELERRLGPSGPARDDLVDASAKALRKLLALPRWWHDDFREDDMAHHKDKHAGNGDQLRALQIRLTGLQRQVISEGRKLLVIFEGRDAAGKDGTIKRIAEHMSPRDTRVVALGVPSEHDRKAWYFQRYCAELPIAGEIALFNRSWYNRAGVERVMGFCSDAEYEQFMTSVGMFEQLLVDSGITIVKYYLDISKGEQKRRIHEREHDPLKQWKISPIDKKAVKNWKKYSEARNAMLARTHSVFAPWVVVKADDKPAAHLAVIRDLLARCGAFDPDADDLPDPATVFVYDAHALENGWLEE